MLVKIIIGILIIVAIAAIIGGFLYNARKEKEEFYGEPRKSRKKK